MPASSVTIGRTSLKRTDRAGGTAASFLSQRRTHDEGAFVHRHEPSETHLERRILLRVDQRFPTAVEVHVDEEKPGFESCHIERKHARWPKIERRSVQHQGIPHLDGRFDRHPDLVTQIPCVPGARNFHGNLTDAAGHHAKVFQRIDVGLRRRPHDARGHRPLEGKGGNTFRDILDLDIQPHGVLPKPSQTGIGRGPSILLLVQSRDRPVIDHLALLIAPGCVPDLPDAHASNVTRDDAVHEPRRVSTGDAVLEERGDVDEGGCVANGVVFVLVVALVRAHGVVARPLAIVQRFAQCEGARVKRRPYGHGRIIEAGGIECAP